MYEIVDVPIDSQRLVQRVSAQDCGAVVLFLGVVRASSDDDRPVTGLSYEAYGALAITEMERIGKRVQEKFAPVRIAMTHRTGSLNVGEPSVAVAVATPHRAQAFAACEYAMNELKSRVPIWKKEHYVHGESIWRENCAPHEVKN
ncbi:MAG: molybdenum cofactor biosynthesis protein MoaE [Candidatus Eremiobacteraeota bacterium]|nr:molybdenum cofactor biosynthesis protein MoaE [Candidatus Eremiobacteraeota bacterium]